MKKIVLFAALLGVMVSCSSSSSDSGSGNNGNNQADQNFIPLSSPNSWVYQVTTPSTSTNPATVSRDSLYVNGTIQFPNNTNTYVKFNTLNQPNGFYSNCLNNNGLRKSGTDYLLTGTVQFDPINSGTPLVFNLNDFAIFKQNAAADQELSSQSGTINQTLGTTPLVISYTLKTKAMSDLSNFTVPGTTTTYPTVKRVNTTLTMQINASLNGFSVSFMDQQTVVDAVQHYVADKGNVYSTTRIKYQLSALAISALAQNPNSNIPGSSDVTQTELLVRH